MRKRPAPKIVYIAHPISGAVKSNISRIEKILEAQLQSRQRYMACAPYLDCCRYLTDDDEDDRERSFAFNKRFFETRLIDELWVCGRVSRGVRQEIDWAIEFGISVVFKDYDELVA